MALANVCLEGVEDGKTVTGTIGILVLTRTGIVSLCLSYVHLHFKSICVRVKCVFAFSVQRQVKVFIGLANGLT